MDHDGDMVWILEGRGAAIKRGVIERPFRRCRLPNQLREIVPVIFITLPTALGGEIELIPPLELGLWRQRLLAGLLSADQVTTHGNHGLAAFGPEHRHDVGGAGAPIKSADYGLLDLEGIHQSDDIRSDRRRLTT